MNCTFLVCFFHTTRFFFLLFCFCLLSVWRGRFALTLSITHFMLLYRHPQRRTFPHQARVAAHEAIPSCSFAHSSSAMASICFALFTSSMSLSFNYDHCHLLRSPHNPFLLGEFRLRPLPIQSFSISHFPKTPRVLKVELSLSLTIGVILLIFAPPTSNTLRPGLGLIVEPVLFL